MRGHCEAHGGLGALTRRAAAVTLLAEQSRAEPLASLLAQPSRLHLRAAEEVLSAGPLHEAHHAITLMHRHPPSKLPANGRSAGLQLHCCCSSSCALVITANHKERQRRRAHLHVIMKRCRTLIEKSTSERAMRGVAACRIWSKPQSMER